MNINIEMQILKGPLLDLFLVKNGKKEVILFDILREAFLFKNHSITNDDEFLEFLIQGGMTHRELQSCGFPLRRIQMISKKVRGE